MFIDLAEIIKEQKPKVESFTNQKVMLTDIFKGKYLNAMEEKSSVIEFLDTFSIVTTSKKLHIYIPNQWFYLAYIGAPLTKKIVEYRNFIKDNSNLTNNNFSNFITEAKKGNLDEIVFKNIVKGLSKEESLFIKKILTDYNWWGGAKDLSRTDYYVSPILNLLDLVNVSSSYVSEISYLIAENFILDDYSADSLFDLVEETNTLLDYETMFREWILNTQKNADSNIKYVNTLNRFVVAVNSELSNEDFAPISIYSDPKIFADQYSIDSIMEIANRLKPNTAFIPNGSGSGSELKTIYKKYLEWVHSLPDSLNNELQINNSILNNEHRQYIYFGAPGTGKSFRLGLDSKSFGRNIERVTFHPNMTYGSFIGVFKPFPQKIILRDSDGNVVFEDDTPIYEEKITYKYVPGPLIKQLVNALMHPDKMVLLIIEEMNRANVAAVFGDLFQLLDRKTNHSSEYPISISEDLQRYFDTVYKKTENKTDISNMKRLLKDGLIFPSNFFIWTTMNSADQGVMPMDTAFKRRWELRYFGLDDAWKEGDGKIMFSSYKKIEYQSMNGGDIQMKTISWNVIRRIINDILSTNRNIPEDKLLGPFFISEKVLTSTNAMVTESFQSKVLSYLFDDVAKQDRTLIFKNVDKMRYSEIVDKFKKEGLKLFDINDDDIDKYEKDEYSYNIRE